MPAYLKESRLVMLSKTGKSEADLNDIRPIAIASHMTKVIEKAIKNKLTKLDSELLKTKEYQTGFQVGVSTQKNLAILLNVVMKTRRKSKERKVYVSCDMRKAYDSVSYQKIVETLKSRAKTEEEKHISALLINLINERKVHVGSKKIDSNRGVP